MSAPSERQLAYIRDLGYQGKSPETKDAASVVIACLKNGRSGQDAERLMELPAKERTIDYLRRYIGRCERGKENLPAGWRLKVPKGTETPSRLPYKDAFLPFEVGKRHPELLIIGSPNLAPGDDGEQNEIGHYLNGLQNRPKKGPVVLAPGQIADIETTPTPARKQTKAKAPVIATDAPQTSKRGCLSTLAMVFLAFCAALAMAS